MKAGPYHDQISIALKTVKVDIGIAPVVEWLNGYRDIYTQYSCQGGGGIPYPYVVFFAFDYLDVQEVLEKTHKFAELREEDFPNDYDCLPEDHSYVSNTRFVLSFHTSNHLVEFLKTTQTREEK